MTIELGGFLALGGLIIGLFVWLRQDVNRVRSELGDEIKGVRREMSELQDRLETRIGAVELRIGAVELRIGSLEQRMAHLEGLLDGLREAIVARARHPDAA